jgi:hypothetical protein
MNFRGDLIGTPLQPVYFFEVTYFSSSFLFLLTRYTCIFHFYARTGFLPKNGYQRKKGRYTDDGGIIDSGAFFPQASTTGRLGTIRGNYFKPKVRFGHPGLPF